MSEFWIKKNSKFGKKWHQNEVKSVAKGEKEPGARTPEKIKPETIMPIIFGVRAYSLNNRQKV